MFSSTPYTRQTFSVSHTFSQTHQRHRPQSAFTLVELLVVIGIISVLAGMLLPALKNALESTRTISCANNLKQIGTAIQLYVHDNNGYVPPTCYPGFASYYLNYYLDQAGGTEIKQGDLYSVYFNKMSGTFFCPSVSSATESPFYTGTSEPNHYYSSYHATALNSILPLASKNGCWVIRDMGYAGSARKLSEIKDGTVLVCDRLYSRLAAPDAATPDPAISYGHTANWQFSSGSYVKYAPSYVHSGLKGNFLFKDAHVKSYTFTGNDQFDRDYIPVD